MRINKFVAQATGMSRRTADTAISDGRVRINGRQAELHSQVAASDTVTLDGTAIAALAPDEHSTIMLNKPIGYVVSRNGQGSKTIYDLLPATYHTLKPIGRLDKYSSGLLLLTTDGALAQELTHPSRQKTKVYTVTLNKPLQPLHHQMINDFGVSLADGPSRLQLERLQEGDNTAWRVVMHEGRNRQIRRTFEALGYTVVKLHRLQFGEYQLGNLQSGMYTGV